MTLREAADRIAALEQGQIEILRLLRRGKKSVDEEAIQTLLEYAHDECREGSWTVGQLIQASADNPLLLGAIRRCTGGKVNAYGLAVLLPKSLGKHGKFTLRCVADRTRDGRIFCVTGPVTLSQKKLGRMLTCKGKRLA
jgi:hypothetical protein